MAEAVKVALIRDAGFFDWLETHADELAQFELPAVSLLICRCAELHMRQISAGGDPFETGSARPLDYGHWAAHKLEMLSRHELRHGEAVAVGIALDARYSVARYACRRGGYAHLPAPGAARFAALASGARDAGRRRKDGAAGGAHRIPRALGRRTTITLLAGIGRGEEVGDMDEPELLRAITWLRMRSYPHAA